MQNNTRYYCLYILPHCFNNSFENNMFLPFKQYINTLFSVEIKSFTSDDKTHKECNGIYLMISTIVIIRCWSMLATRSTLNVMTKRLSIKGFLYKLIKKINGRQTASLPVSPLDRLPAYLPACLLACLPVCLSV